MRILVYSHSAVVAEYQALFRGMAAAGHDVHLVIPDWWIEGGRTVNGRGYGAGRLNVEVKRPLSHRQHVHAYLGLPFDIVRLRPDVIFLLEEPNSLITSLAMSSAWLVRAPARRVFYTFINDDRDFRSMGVIRSLIYRASFGIVRELADSGVCGSSSARWQMLNRGMRALLPVIYFGCEVALRQGSEWELVWARRNPLRIAFFGRLVAGKGVDLLLRAYRELPNNVRSGTELHIFGNGPVREAIEQQIEHGGADSSIRLHAAISPCDVRTEMARTAIVVVPSRREGDWVEQFGRVAAEALAEGCVTIVSDSGALPEVVGAVGFVFPENSVSGLAQRLGEALALDMRQRIALSAAANRHAWERFSTPSITRQYLDLFDQLTLRPQAYAKEL